MSDKTQNITPLQLSMPLLVSRVHRVLRSLRRAMACSAHEMTYLGEFKQRYQVRLCMKGWQVKFRDMP